MEHIPEQKTQLVTLPGSLLQALYKLQKEPTRYEWGGGIDFEIIAGYPQVERILAYFGEKGRVPSRVLKKYGRDIEVTFHTHPRQKRVQPSAEDIASFVRSPAQVSMIIAGEEIGLFEKRADFETLIKDPPSISLPVHYEPEIAMPKIKEDLSRIGIDVLIYPRSVVSPVFDLEIVRRIVEEEHVS